MLSLSRAGSDVVGKIWDNSIILTVFSTRNMEEDTATIVV